MEDLQCTKMEKWMSGRMRVYTKRNKLTQHLCRGTYCALSVARMLNILTPELIAGAAEYVVKYALKLFSKNYHQ